VLLRFVCVDFVGEHARTIVDRALAPDSRNGRAALGDSSFGPRQRVKSLAPAGDGVCAAARVMPATANMLSKAKTIRKDVIISCIPHPS